MNEEVKSILGEYLIIDNKKIPVKHLRYAGKEKTYIVWTILEENPELFGNDEVLSSVGSVDIDVYSDGNLLKIIKKIKKIMLENDYVWTGDSAEMYEDDTNLNHKTSSFEKEMI